MTKFTHTFKTTHSNGKPSMLTVTYDWATTDEKVVGGWIASDRTIALQRAIRSMTPEEAVTMYGKKVLNASDVGKRPKTDNERIADLVNSGVSPKHAELIVKNPEKLAELLGE